MTDDVDSLLAADPASLSYEQARDGLARIVARLEGGSASLEESLALWERGEALARRCTEWLDDAQRRLDAASGTPEASEPESAPTPRAAPAAPIEEPPW